MSKTYDKKDIGCNDNDLYWPTSIKDTIRWSPFLAIMKHTWNILKPNKGLIPSLLKVFAMFQLYLIDDRDQLGSIAIRRINCKKEKGLYLRTSTLEEIITKFLLNAILHHVGMSWIIWSNEKLNMKWTKLIIPIGWINVLGITQTSVKVRMEVFLNLL